MVLCGDGVVQDYALSVNYWCRSVNQGHPWVAYELGTLYAQGKAGPKNPSEALKWFAIVRKLGSNETDLLLNLMKVYSEISTGFTFEQVKEAEKPAESFAAQKEHYQSNNDLE